MSSRGSGLRIAAIAATVALAAAALIATGGSAAEQARGPAPAQRAAGLPPIKHVFTIVLENKNYDDSFGESPMSPYLGDTLPRKGQLLTEYYGTGHFSLGNYIT